jgi:hypothetical protein
MLIQNDYYSIEVEEKSGTIRSLYDKRAELELIAEPRLSENFRLLVPLPDLEANMILGADQQASSIEQTSNGAVLRWDGPLTNHKGSFDLAVTQRIELVDEAVQFRIAVTNNSQYRLAEVWHGFVGGLMGLGERADTQTMIPSSGERHPMRPFHQFGDPMGAGGGGGMRNAEAYCQYPGVLPMPWVDVYNERIGRGLYFACLEKKPRCHTLHFEMQPGYVRIRTGGTWPTNDEIRTWADDFPTGIVMKWVNFPYTEPGETFEGPAVVLQSHEGDWHAAAKIYRSWFTRHFEIRNRRSNWQGRMHAVGDLMFMLPEGNISHRFDYIPQWAQDTAKYGVKALMISGWNAGGHDRGYPNYSPDPRLGTWDDLRRGIEACHGLGISVLFFANVQPVDVSTDWYREELHKYRQLDAEGQGQQYGFGMGTLGARMGITRPQLTNCDPAFPEYRKIIVDQMRRLVEIGADGIHLDKLGPWHPINFSPQLKGERDVVSLRGLVDCITEMIRACREVNPEFCLSVESSWERWLPHADAWWNWQDGIEHTAVMKYTFPEFNPNFSTPWAWDFNAVNNAIRYGYHLLVGPVRWTQSMADKQYGPLSEYIAEVMRVREDLEDIIFFGEFLDNLETTVNAHENVKYCSHRDPATGRRACVLVNFDRAPQEATIAFDGNAGGAARIIQPFADPVEAKLPAAVAVPSERLAIVVEE